MRQSTCYFFFFNDTATTEIYTLSLHDALPIFMLFLLAVVVVAWRCGRGPAVAQIGQIYLPTINRSEEHTSELQSHSDLVCRLLLEKKNISIFCELSFCRKLHRHSA